jgi:hypothetical protein
LALYKSQGLGKKSDGILGLSPHKDVSKKKLHYLWSLKENGIIAHAQVSFSVTSQDMGETPYALFGGYNSTQIVGGAQGLKTFKNYPNWLGTWALEGQGMYYGAQPMQKPGEDTAYPAIIDTGSSQLSIPPDVFDKIQAEWSRALPNLDCTSDKTFCHIAEGCDSVATKIKPVGFQMSDYVFEINPAQYLYKANENKCYFVIHKCRLPGKNKDLFLIGDAFLRHFYSVYDFDQDQISLGINVHSLGQVTMYKPGERPGDKAASAAAAAAATEEASAAPAAALAATPAATEAAAPAADASTAPATQSAAQTATVPATAENKDATPAKEAKEAANAAAASADSAEAQVPTDIDDTLINSTLVKKQLSKITTK